jgi:CxxC motif-containing protein (DUF1111 family)
MPPDDMSGGGTSNTPPDDITPGGSSNLPPTGGMANNTPPDDTGHPPVSTCGGELPESFVATCSGCHTSNGAANTRYPDLYTFAGTIDEFKERVRTGSTKGMAAYTQAIISDDDIQAAYDFFKGTTRADAKEISLGDIQPLFTAVDNKNPAIVTTRPDGVIVTRAAGRVRGRHEKEGSFASFEPHYFEDRTYGLIIEDFTPTGVNHLRITYLPLKSPEHNGNRITNWRSWKVVGNNATFQFNKYMEDATEADIPPEAVDVPHGGVQTFDETSAPNGRSFAKGESYEFEVGIFIDPAELSTPGSRGSYYTDCFRYQIGIGGLTPENRDFVDAPGPVPAARGGGDTTIPWIVDKQDVDHSIGQMALNIQNENVQNFVEGRRLFHTDFVTGAHSEEGNQIFTEQKDKAGPLFATTSCTNCHLNNGPGTTVTTFSESTSMAFKLYNSGDLGNQLQLQEGTASLDHTETKDVTLGDGTVVTLKRPFIKVTADQGTVGGFSARVARKLVGLGLLEAISEETILSRADRLDCDGNGISGRPSFVHDPQTGVLRIGRMGWKAEKIDVVHQVADAASADLGVSSSIFPEAGGKAELSDEDVMKLATYMRLVGVLPQRNATDPQVMQGEMLFKTVGCANCHVTDAVTGPNHPFTELRNQSIKPYTDLLLHDMGPDLADDSGIQYEDRDDAPPAASEWRTSPLTSIGVLFSVGANTSLLHDGRAASVLEAVLWHGGEASGVVDNFKALPTADREALLAFVNSL